MNIAILDDSKEDLRQVKSVISSYYESQNTSADIHLYSSAEAFYKKLVDCLEKCLICRHIRRFAD